MSDSYSVRVPKGRLTTRQVCRALGGVHYRTALRWANAVFAGEVVVPRGAQSRITDVTRIGGGYWTFSKDEIDAVAADFDVE